MRIIQQKNTKFLDHHLYPQKMNSKIGKWVAHQTWNSNSDTALNGKISATGMSPPGKRNQTIMIFHWMITSNKKQKKGSSLSLTAKASIFNWISGASAAQQQCCAKPKSQLSGPEGKVVTKWSVLTTYGGLCYWSSCILIQEEKETVGLCQTHDLAQVTALLLKPPWSLILLGISRLVSVLILHLFKGFSQRKG